MYLALARKYRPQRFSDLIGQPHVVKTLQNAVEMDKLYPALIFSGMKGVGKTSAARILAKALNCENGPSREPCNECRFCREITADQSSDYIEIDGASNNGVEEVRRLRETVKYKPMQNRYRVVVIDEVHMLSNSAWNALLKTVEEPPEHTYFIMATTDFHKIPATIVSRCQHLEFRRIPFEVIARLLREICKRESVKVSDYAVFLIARSSEGSLRDAKKVLDQAIALSNGDVRDEDVVDILGVIEEELFIRLTEAVLQRRRKDIILSVQELVERGADLRFFYGEYLKFLRDLIVVHSMEDPGSLHNLNPENLTRIREILAAVKEEELLRYFQAAKEMEMTVRHTENPRIILEYLFLKLSYFPDLVAIEEAIRAMNTQASIGETPVHSVISDLPPAKAGNGFSGDKKAEPQADVPDISAETIRVWWIEDLERNNPRLASHIRAASVECDGNRVRVVVDGGNGHVKSVLDDNLEVLERSLAKRYRRRLPILVDVGRDTRAEVEKEMRSDRNIKDLAEQIRAQMISVDKIQGGGDGQDSEHQPDDTDGSEHGSGSTGEKERS
ncbi:MAG TPA: DNA polymerase III subunit gamma/tau [Candidatus Aminicenantes bacterium]|nr:DNA polymerase III subunit gamma/tau [Candidatus Aminicenantes bacterium]